MFKKWYHKDASKIGILCLLNKQAYTAGSQICCQSKTILIVRKKKKKN